jgi:hypothetical protein
MTLGYAAVRALCYQRGESITLTRLVCRQARLLVLLEWINLLSPASIRILMLLTLKAESFGCFSAGGV